MEQCLAIWQSLWFSWDWGQLKQGKISNYEADPRNGIVRNLENGCDKPLRRLLVPNM